MTQTNQTVTLERDGAILKFPAPKSARRDKAQPLTHVVKAELVDGLYVLEFKRRSSPQHALVAPIAPTSSSATNEVWHRRLAHSPLSARLDVLRPRVRDLHVTRAPHGAAPHDPSKCEACRLYKAKRRAHPDTSGHMVARGPAQVVHVDGAEPRGMPLSKEGYRGFYLFVDDFDSTKFAVGYSRKSEALLCYQAYFAWVRATLPPGTVKFTNFMCRIKSDYAGELSQGNVKRFLEAGGHGRVHSST